MQIDGQSSARPGPENLKPYLPQTLRPMVLRGQHGQFVASRPTRLAWGTLPRRCGADDGMSAGPKATAPLIPVLHVRRTLRMTFRSRRDKAASVNTASLETQRPWPVAADCPVAHAEGILSVGFAACASAGIGRGATRDRRHYLRSRTIRCALVDTVRVLPSPDTSCVPRPRLWPSFTSTASRALSVSL